MSATAADVFARLDRELWIVTAQAGARRGGLVATFVNQASIVPDLPRVLLGVATHHHTWELIEASGAFALHLLDAARADWVWRFGLHSGRDLDKLAGLTVRAGASGSPLLVEALAWLDCRVEHRLDTGDRTIYLAEVLEAGLKRADPPLTVRRLVEHAPPDQLATLKEQMAQDIVVDAQAIKHWRQRRGTGGERRDGP